MYKLYLLKSDEKRFDRLRRLLPLFRFILVTTTILEVELASHKGDNK